MSKPARIADGISRCFAGAVVVFCRKAARTETTGQLPALDVLAQRLVDRCFLQHAAAMEMLVSPEKMELAPLHAASARMTMARAILKMRRPTPPAKL